MVSDFKDVEWNNLNQNERQALEKLRSKKSIVIKIADKGGSILVMNRADNVDKIKKDLNNRKYYKKLDCNNIDNIINEKQLLINQIKDYLDETEYNTLMDDSDLPAFYGLPKIHKEYENFPPLRPIVAGYDSVTVKLSKYVDSYLKPAAQKSFSFVRDTTHFLKKLRNVRKIPRNSFMVTMDVHSLCNNIDHQKGAEACFHALEERNQKVVSSKTLKSMILFILKNNVFRFSNLIYQQILGTAMGTPMSCNFANLFMSEMESNVFNEYETATGIRHFLWLRYIDDVFFLWFNDEESLQKFIKFVRTYSKSKEIQSSLDYDVFYSPDTVKFLDCTVRIKNYEFETELYTKDKDAHLYLLSSLCHPKHTIKAIPKGQLIRIRRICSSIDLCWKHANKYIDFFTNRGYNIQTLQSIVDEIAKVDRKEFLEDKSKQTDKVSSIPKDLFTQYHPHICKLPFILNKHKGILSELSNCFPRPPRVFFRRKRNLKDILCKSDVFSNSVKEEMEWKQPCNHGNCKLCSSIAASNKITNKQNNNKFEIKHGGTCRTKKIIYAAECRKHKKLYIGQGKCQLNKRFCGHRFDIKKISTKPLN